MYRLIRSVSALVVAVAATAAAGSATAETRLFSARTAEPGVTIVQAVRNGQQLPVAGQSDGATFFRIDNPAGAVPCANRMRFTASNGAVVDAPVDLCANNWELTVALGGAIPPAGGGQIGGQPVVITTDDPSVTITDVFLRGKKVPIAARQDPYVQINVLGSPAGFECSRDLGLALSDGRRIARLVDICQGNFLVVVALVGGPRPPAPPPSFSPPLAVVQPLPEPPAPPEPDQPEIVTGMQWMFSAGANRGSFAYGIPETDASEFTAVCQARSSKVTVTLTRSADEIGPGGKVLVRLSAGTFAKTYTATGSEISELDGLSHPVFQIGTADPLWPALIKGSVLGIGFGSSPAYGLSLSGSAVKAKQFLAVCNPAAVAPPPPVAPPPGQGGAALGFTCNDGSFINVAFDDSTAVVYEIGAPPVVLLAAPSFGNGPRYVGGLSELVGEGDQVFWTRDGGYARTCVPG